jgi:hypothetical protein
MRLSNRDLATILSGKPVSEAERRRIVEAMMTEEERELSRCAQELLAAGPPPGEWVEMASRTKESQR